MKKILVSFLAVLALTASLYAQDSRGRVVTTVVSDVLAQMPAANAEALEAQMADLAASAPASVEVLCSMFQPAENQANNKFEYALSGVVRYVTTPAGEKYKSLVEYGLKKAIGDCSDNVAKAFFESELRLLGAFEPAVCEVPSQAQLLSEAKTLAKSGKTNERIQSMWLYHDALGSKNASNVIAAMKDPVRAYRWAALETAGSYADNAFYKKLGKAFAGVSAQAKDDILYWLGEQGAESQIDLIIKQFGGANAVEAIAAAGKIGGAKASAALLGALDGAHSDAAVAALERFNGDISGDILEALKTASGEKLGILMSLASKRHITDAADQFLTLAASGDAKAVSTLAGVVSEDNIKAVAELLDKASSEGDIAAFSDALVASVASYDSEGQFDAIVDAMLASSNKSKFYNAIAATGTGTAVNLLAGAALSGSEEASKALALTDNADATKFMLAFAGKDEAYLGRYIDLVNKYEGDVTDRSLKLIDALALASSSDMKKKVIGNLSDAPSVEAFYAVVPYLEDKAVIWEASHAVKNISGKVGAFIPYEDLEKAAAKAMEYLKSTGDADDGYAVDALKNTLSDNKPYPVSELTPEEKEAGFIMLYDGTNLDNWTGDKNGYQSYNGVINVTANYGGSGNLYTKDEYRNFIYRFEFRFLVNAANNGVGLRGPATGVDAAYDAMCEVQILDHDDPVYANLRPYQVHGSVYGVIPAKRIVHKPLGEWGYEEIKVVGDHITVTVNGEVVVDGDIREACQGHNVDPDGGDRNPYTADHNNHPGMFNERGHISFCGHGRGLQMRNVRILPLPDEK